MNVSRYRIAAIFRLRADPSSLTWCPRRRRISALHIYEKIRVLGEQFHLTGRVASIGAKRVRVNEFADRQPVGYFSNG
jgi:hypothetical protein